MIDTVHYDIATTKILASSCYSTEEKNISVASAHYYLNLISEIEGKTVDYQSYTDKDIKLNIHIKDIRFGHNNFTIYADRLVLKYITDYIKDQVKVYNENCIHLIDNTKNVWISGNGWGTGISINYENYLYKKVDPEAIKASEKMFDEFYAELKVKNTKES